MGSCRAPMIATVLWLLVVVTEVRGHAYLTVPQARGDAARIAAGTVPDDFNKINTNTAPPSNFAGQEAQPCGPKTPNPEAIKATWTAGSTVDVTITNTITHGGQMKLALIPAAGAAIDLLSPVDYQNPTPFIWTKDGAVGLQNGPGGGQPGSTTTMRVKLPDAVTCPATGCVLQWLWDSSDGKLYFGCSDVEITAVGGGGGGGGGGATNRTIAGTVTLAGSILPTTTLDDLRSDFRAGLATFLSVPQDSIAVTLPAGAVPAAGANSTTTVVVGFVVTTSDPVTAAATLAKTADLSSAAGAARLTSSLKAAGTQSLAEVAVSATSMDGSGSENEEACNSFLQLMLPGLGGIEVAFILIVLALLGAPAILLMVGGERSGRTFLFYLRSRTSAKKSQEDQLAVRVLGSRLCLLAFVQAGASVFLTFGSWPFGAVGFLAAAIGYYGAHARDHRLVWAHLCLAALSLVGCCVVWGIYAGLAGGSVGTVAASCGYGVPAFVGFYGFIVFVEVIHAVACIVAIVHCLLFVKADKRAKAATAAGTIVVSPPRLTQIPKNMAKTIRAGICGHRCGGNAAGGGDASAKATKARDLEAGQAPAVGGGDNASMATGGLAKKGFANQVDGSKKPEKRVGFQGPPIPGRPSAMPAAINNPPGAAASSSPGRAERLQDLKRTRADTPGAAPAPAPAAGPPGGAPLPPLPAGWSKVPAPDGEGDHYYWVSARL